MNTIKSIEIALVAIVVLFTSGCGEDKSCFNQTRFPSVHWRVVVQGTNGEVVVETTSTNLVDYLRVHRAVTVTLLTNGQPARVEMVIRWDPSVGKVRLISSKAYPKTSLCNLHLTLAAGG